MKRLLIFILLYIPTIIFCNPSNLDTSFNQIGINDTIPGTAVISLTSTATPENLTSQGNAVALQTDGKVVLAGYGTFPTAKQLTVTRFLENGELDETFNSSETPGYNTFQISGATESIANAIAIDYASGNIVITGYTVISSIYKVFVIRFLPDGTVDTSFNSTGIAIFQIPSTASACNANGICIQANSNILICGEYNENLGIFVARILGAGSSAGTLDTSFNSTGYATLFTGITSNCFAVGVDPLTNKVLLTGYTTVSSIQQIFVARYTTSGLLDNAIINPSTPYGTNGQGYTTTNIDGGAQALAFTIKGNGAVVTVGQNLVSFLSPTPIALAQFTPNGQLDTDFNTTGVVLTQIIGNEASTSAYANGVQIDNTGEIVVSGTILYTSGTFDTFFARYNPNGSLDTNFTPSGYVIPSINTQTATSGLALDPNGKAITTGYTFIDDYVYTIAIRIIGGSSENQSTPSITQYGHNAQFINEFLYQNFYATVISNSIAQVETINSINEIIATYSSDYSIQPSFNYIAYLYLLQTQLANAQVTLLETYPTSTDEINLCFELINARILQLIEPI